MTGLALLSDKQHLVSFRNPEIVGVLWFPFKATRKQDPQKKHAPIRTHAERAKAPCLIASGHIGCLCRIRFVNRTLTILESNGSVCVLMIWTPQNVRCPVFPFENQPKGARAKQRHAQMHSSAVNHPKTLLHEQVRSVPVLVRISKSS